MDIKKPDGPVRAPTLTTQTSPSSDQKSQQLEPPVLKNNSGLNIRVGQQVELLVLQLTEGKAILKIIGMDQQVHTSDISRLQIGQKLQATITDLEPVIRLKITNPKLANTNKPTNIVNAALRKSLPLQQNIQELIQGIKHINAQPETSKQDKLLNAIRNFTQSLPPLPAFKEADVLPQILKKSGLFTESALANFIIAPKTQPTFPNNDLKIALLRLAENLRQLQTHRPEADNSAINKPLPAKSDSALYSPEILQQATKNPATGTKLQNSSIHQSATVHKETALPLAAQTEEQLITTLLKQTDGVLARLQTLQLQHLQSNEQHKPQWMFELPVRTENSTESLFIYIEQDASEKHKRNYIVPWKVILKFNIEELGAIQAHVTLRANKVSVNFWAEDKNTYRLFNEYLDILSSQLDSAGLETGQLNCRCEKAPALPVQQATVISEKI